MRARWLVFFLMMMAAGLATIKYAYDLGKSRQPAKPVPVACGDPVAGCRLTVGGKAVEIRFSEPPAPMKAFTLQVRAKSSHAVMADFAMVGMDMGPNRYRLQVAGPDTWQAKVMLPVCMVGGSDWTMLLELDGMKLSVPFHAERAAGR